ncbi:MAG: fibronectin type III domain-containing protein, partial [Bacteroidia bacterium]|nr:fibronectin type III domain-containing protein [Bacteroidia bacterium]
MNSFYPTLKRLCMFMALLLVVISTNGQSVSNYLFSTNNVSSLNRTAGSLIDDIDMNTGTTIHVGGSQNNSTSATQPIGFDFFVNGTRQTTFNVTSNGWVSIGGFASAFYGFLNVAAGVRVTPFLGTSGATGSMGTSSIGRVHSKVVGSQPNRVLVVEFLRMAIPANTTNDTNTFQVRLYEATGSIEFVYGKMKVNSGAPLSFNTGFQFSSSLYQHVNINTHTASTSSSTPNNIATNGSIASLDNENLGSQRSYMWIPDPVSDAGAITVSNVTTTSMRLTWNDVANEIGYVLYRSTDGGLTYTYQFNLGANVNIVNISALIANTTYHWRVYALRESISAPADGSGATLPATKFYTIASGNWSDPNIWNTLAVPSAQDSAEISVSHNVVLDLASIACGALIVKGNLSYWSSSTYQVLTTNGDVIVENGGVFTAGTASYTTGTPFRLNIGGNLSTIDVPGSLIVNGTLDLATANTAVEVRFNGINSGTISGSGAICELPFIYVDKSLVANTIEVLRTYTQPQSNTWFTFTQRLQVQTGTFKISAPVVTNSFSTTTLLFASNTNGRLWLNHPSINLGMHPSSINGQMQLQGELRIDDGTLSVGTGSQSQFVTINGAIRMNGGQLNIFGSLQILNTAAATLIVNSGRIVIDPQAATSLNTFTNAFVVNALASFSFSGGSIEIVDPHAAAGGTSISVQSGGSKSITGGSFIIGNDLATTTGGTLSTTSGFSINCAYPIYKLIVKNNISSFPSRTLRLLNGLTIIDSLIINTNGYLQTTSAGTGYNLQVLGHVLNNGTISGTTPTFTGQGFGQVNFEGTTLQRVSGAGNATSLKMRIANPAGVNFTNTSAWLLDLVILEKGNVTNTAGALTIGGPTYRGDVTIGGLDETTTAGSFSTIPAINTTFDLVNYTYGPAANSLQTGSFNEMSAGSANIGTLTINDAQGVTANRNISLQDGLNLTTGLLKMGNNSLTLGTSATSGGVLTRVDGFVQLGASGSFTRWFTTGSFFSYNYTLGFPLSNGLSERSVLLSLNGANFTTGGNLTVRHNNISSYTDISPTFTDGTTTINRRSNSYWLISSSSAPGLTGRTLKVRLIGAGIGAISNVAELRIVKSNSAFGGTTQAGSGTVTAPEINRDFSQANLSAGIVYDTMYVGTNLGINPLSPTIIAINTGNWNDPATWEDNVIPSISNSAIIATGVNVTIPAAYTALCNGLSISAGATLTAS